MIMEYVLLVLHSGHIEEAFCKQLCVILLSRVCLEGFRRALGFPPTPQD